MRKTGRSLRKFYSFPRAAWLCGSPLAAFNHKLRSKSFRLSCLYLTLRSSLVAPPITSQLRSAPHTPSGVIPPSIVIPGHYVLANLPGWFVFAAAIEQLIKVVNGIYAGAGPCPCHCRRDMYWFAMNESHEYIAAHSLSC